MGVRDGKNTPSPNKKSGLRPCPRQCLYETGGLHFANIEMEDERQGLHYVCVVRNTVLRNRVQGDDQVLRPHFVRGDLLFSSSMSFKP